MTTHTKSDVIRNSALAGIDPDSPTLWEDIYGAGVKATLDFLEEETFITSTEREAIKGADNDHR